MKIRQIPYLVGPLLFLLAQVLPESTFTGSEKMMLGILAWMLTWWITEVVNLAITALLPIVLLPATGILPIDAVTKTYGHPLIYLFFGGFVLALAIEKWNLHRRIALFIISKIGHSPKRILLGFMLATSFLSAWISNTATTVMMLPMVMSVIQLMEKAGFTHKKTNAALLIGIAWAANIGGLSTLIGSPPNLVFSGFMYQEYNLEITFTDWIKVGLPVAIVLFTAAYFILGLLLGKDAIPGKEVEEYFQTEWKNLGKLEGAEKRVAIIFAATALLWIIRPQILKLLPDFIQFTDTSVAILASLVLFVFPSGNESRTLLNWGDTSKLAWGILILFGGGMALASGMNESGLLHHITDAFSGQNHISHMVFILAMAALGVWATEVMSNMALVAAMMPILAAISAATGEPFQFLALPLTLGASCAFMLPMATPPNAIVFGSGELKMTQMVKNGIWMNIAATIIITAVCSFFLNSLT